MSHRLQAAAALDRPFSERSSVSQGIAANSCWNWTSSLAAEPFYRSHGYEVQGVRRACPEQRISHGVHQNAQISRTEQLVPWSLAVGYAKSPPPVEIEPSPQCPSLRSRARPTFLPASRRPSSGSRPPHPHKPDFDAAEAFVWRAERGTLAPVAHVNRVDLSLLRGVDRVRDLLVENTERFARGLPANNALLWGARGMGKSSLVKAAHAAINRQARRRRPPQAGRDPSRGHRGPAGADGPSSRGALRFIVFCDDLSFDAGDASYKSLKAALEGGVEGRPANVLFYATSNRRHLMPRDMMENERGSAINPGEAVEEKVSLSDRFGLWLGFHHCSQDDYLAMVHGYAKHYRARGACRRDRGPGARMGDDAGLPLGPHRLAVHSGSGGATREAACRDRLTSATPVTTSAGTHRDGADLGGSCRRPDAGLLLLNGQNRPRLV